MAASELDKIRSNPIEDGLDNFRRLFESTRVDLGIAETTDAVELVFSTAATTGMAHLLVLRPLANV